jgi:hypothetical protein
MLLLREVGTPDGLPFVPNNEFMGVEENLADPDEAEMRASFLRFAKRITAREVFKIDTNYASSQTELANIHVSECYSCGKLTLWLYDSILYPPERHPIEANPDLNADIRADFDEARIIVNLSPRGAAALLRLCIQKLCMQLGKPGKNLDEDIASLVRDGLSPTVQKALDIVRVIGNEAVHPGQVDLRDDRDTALTLFDLVNRIAHDTITHPREISEMYEKLPPAKREAIEKRDGAKKP